MPVRPAGTETRCSREEIPSVELEREYCWATGAFGVSGVLDATEMYGLKEILCAGEDCTFGVAGANALAGAGAGALGKPGAFDSGGEKGCAGT